MVRLESALVRPTPIRFTVGVLVIHVIELLAVGAHKCAL
jgi:hypothetical protein